MAPSLTRLKHLPILLTLSLSIALPLLTITPAGFPYTGLALSFLALCLSALLFKAKTTAWNWALAAFSVLFSLCLIIRANPLLLFFDIVSLLLLLGAQILPNTYLKHFSELAFLPLVTLQKTMSASNTYPFRLKPNLSLDSLFPAKTLLTLALTVLVVVATVPFLSAANPIFANLTDSLFKFFDLSNLLNRLFSESGPFWLARVSLFIVLFLLIPRAISYLRSDSVWQSHRQLFSESLPLLLPKLTIIVIFLIFFATQAQLYFATTDTLMSLNYTNSQATREIFAHLIVVCLIAFTLIYNDRSTSRLNKWATLILLFCVALMNLIAVKSDADYVSLFGFTEKRLYGFSANLWIFGALVLYALQFFRANLDNLVKSLFLWFMAVLLLINLANFDFLIYNLDKAKSTNGDDLLYLSSLSPDTGNYRQRVEQTFAQIDKNDFRTFSPASRMLINANHIRSWSKNMAFQTFNLSNYTAASDISTLDLEGLGHTLSTVASAHPIPPAKFSSQVQSTSASQIKPFRVVLNNIDPRFTSKRYQLLKRGDNSNTRQDGNLSGNSFVHSLGAGEFLLVISLDYLQQPSGFTPSRDIVYVVPPDFNRDSLEIDFSQF